MSTDGASQSSSDWASRLARAIKTQLDRNAEGGSLVALDVVGGSGLVVVYAGADDTAFGLYVSEDEIAYAAPTLVGKPITEIAFLIVEVGMLEPRDPRDYPRDRTGVRWIPLTELC